MFRYNNPKHGFCFLLRCNEKYFKNRIKINKNIYICIKYIYYVFNYEREASANSEYTQQKPIKCRIMISHDISLFMRGTAFMYLLMASSYFLIVGKERLKIIVGLVMLYWLLQYIKGFVPVAIGIKLSNDELRLLNIIDMTAVPTCAFILIELIRPGWVTCKRVLLHELPFIAMVILYFFIQSVVVYDLTLIVSLLYSLVISIFLIINIPIYHKQLKEQYSFTENLDVVWLWNILIFFAIFFAIWIYSCLSLNEWVNSIYYGASSALWITICYFISKHIIAMKLISKNEAEYEDTEYSYDLNLPEYLPQQYHFIERLYQLIEKDEIFLNSKLTLSDIAHELKTNRTYLSEYLNNVLHQNFFDFINEYRLKYASNLLINNSLITIEQVAERSGFNSLSTFRRSFAKKYKSTPHNYRKKLNSLI